MARNGKTGQRGDFGRDITEPKYSPEEVIEAFRASLGSVADAARELGCDRKTLYRYCSKHPNVQAALDEVRGGYKQTCQEFARDNHLTQLINGGKEATAYELAKLEPKAEGHFLDTTKLSTDELVELRRLLLKAKPDGTAES